MHSLTPLVLTAVATLSPLSMAQSDEGILPELVPFQFDGGTLIEFLAAVEATFPEPDLVVFPGGLEKIDVPSMNVRSADSEALLTIVESMSATGPGWAIEPLVTLITDEIVVVKAFVLGNPFSVAPSVHRSSVVRVYGLPGGATMEDTLGALEAGISMTGDSKAVIRFHEPTGIIFLDATEQAQEVAASVLSQLRENLANTARTKRRE